MVKLQNSMLLTVMEGPRPFCPERNMSEAIASEDKKPPAKCHRGLCSQGYNPFKNIKVVLLDGIAWNIFGP
jgi:hypothetical protein